MNGSAKRRSSRGIARRMGIGAGIVGCGGSFWVSSGESDFGACEAGWGCGVPGRRGGTFGEFGSFGKVLTGG